MVQFFETTLIAGLPSNWIDLDARTIDAIILLHNEFRKEPLA